TEYKQEGEWLWLLPFLTFVERTASSGLQTANSRRIWLSAVGHPLSHSRTLTRLAFLMYVDPAN
ncbi:MAG: hypothetical protein U9R47_04105, partial [Actinomycetota bacterium]|nr:hypothetical protein [Actinomycetota bacterium]